MAHLPPELLAGADPFSQPKTLFLPSPGKEGILLTRVGSGYRTARKRFKSAHAALTWCQDHDAGLVFWTSAATDPARN